MLGNSLGVLPDVDDFEAGKLLVMPSPSAFLDEGMRKASTSATKFESADERSLALAELIPPFFLLDSSRVDVTERLSVSAGKNVVGAGDAHPPGDELAGAAHHKGGSQPSRRTVRGEEGGDSSRVEEGDMQHVDHESGRTTCCELVREAIEQFIADGRADFTADADNSRSIRGI